MTGPAKSRVKGPVKGWCPGALRPMASGDGLILRVRPWASTLSPDQVLGLAALATRYGSGTLELTSRANLQIRGLTDKARAPVTDGLRSLDLLDPDPDRETRRNILVTPDWKDGDRTDRLHRALVAALPDLPPLPAKMGFALDTGPRRVLTRASADLRIERGAQGGLLVRADGAPLGLPVVEAELPDRVREILTWFAETGGPGSGRMAKHLTRVPLPAPWQRTAPCPVAPLRPGQGPNGATLGAAFGAVPADALCRAMVQSGAQALRLLPHRLFRLVGGTLPDGPFLTDPDDPLLRSHACPGAPHCAEASVATRPLARTLAARLAPGQTLHVSGCAKGCAHPGRANVVLVGRDGAFDLVRDGAPWDEPCHPGLVASELPEVI